MRSILTAPIALAGAIFAAACVPFVTLTDYTPEVQGGTVKIGHCLGTRSVEFTLDEVLVRAKLAVYPHAPKGRPQIRFAFSIPAGRTVQLTSDQIVLSPLPAGVAVPLRIPGFSTTNDNAREFTALTPMVGGVRRLQDRSVPEEYWTTVVLGREPESDVRLVFPDIRINGKPITISPVTFRRTPRVELMVPINC